MVHAFFLLKSALIAVTVSSAIAASDLVKFVVSPSLKSIVGVKQEVGVLIHKLGQLNLVKELRGRVYSTRPYLGHFWKKIFLPLENVNNFQILKIPAEMPENS